MHGNCLRAWLGAVHFIRPSLEFTCVICLNCARPLRLMIRGVGAHISSLYLLLCSPLFGPKASPTHLSSSPCLLPHSLLHQQRPHNVKLGVLGPRQPPGQLCSQEQGLAGPHTAQACMAERREKWSRESLSSLDGTDLCNKGSCKRIPPIHWPTDPTKTRLKSPQSTPALLHTLALLSAPTSSPTLASPCISGLRATAGVLTRCGRRSAQAGRQGGRQNGES